MADPSVFDFMRIPIDTLIALDNRPLHFAMQPYHYIVRLTHIVTMGAFFGGIVLLDLRLLGWRGVVALRAFADQVLPWLYGTFAVTFATGVALFAYDPVHVGAHAYFAPKLALLAVGLGNAVLFHRVGFLKAVAAVGPMPRMARIAGALSLGVWAGVLVCSSLNVEPAPKVLLR